MTDIDGIKLRRAVVRRRITTVMKKLDERGKLDGDEGLVICAEADKYILELEGLNDSLAVETTEEEADKDFDALLQSKVSVSAHKAHFKSVITKNVDILIPEIPLGPPVALPAESESTQSTSVSGVAAFNNITYSAQNPTFSSSGQPFVNVPMMRVQDIAHFDGNPLKWQYFWDSFNHAVHKHDSLGGCQKMTLLKSCLEGEAARAIEGWTTTDTNYQSAMSYLKSRFGNVEDQKQALWAQFLALENIRSENPAAVRRLLDKTHATLRSLEGLGVPPSSYSSMMKVVLRQKLPVWLDAQWLLSHHSPEAATVDELVQFLEKKIRAHEQATILMRHDHGEPTRTRPSPRPFNFTNRATVMSSNSRHCFYCNDTSHALWTCPMSLDERRAITRQKGACYNCLRLDHMASRCPSNTRCRHCGRGHHSTLHPQSGIMPSAPGNGRPQQHADSTVARASISHLNSSPDVLLPVVAVPVVGRCQVMARCLLDTGSTSSFISRDLANRICAPRMRNIQLMLSTFASPKNQHVEAAVVRCTLKSHGGDRVFEPIVLPELGIHQAVPSMSLPCVKELQHQHGLVLSDNLTGSSQIDMLIGSDLYGKVTTGKRVALDDGVVALETCFGWALQGPVNIGRRSANSTVMFLKSTCTTLEEKVSAFWDIEEVPAAPQGRDQEPFSDLIKFNGQRYEVPLLWKGCDRPTPNESSAAQFFRSQMQKSIRNNKWDSYKSIMTEYKQFGAIEDDLLQCSEGYYLPHHAVCKPSSDTHPLRIVFNGSAKVSGSALSLNDCLDTGPNLLPHVSTILNSFRVGAVPLTGDLQKAFFTISVRPEDRRFLRIKWDPPQRLSRVPFGVNCSPFLLQATIMHHLNICVERGSISIEHFLKLSHSLYMDDIIASFDSIKQGQEFIKVATDTFSSAGMTLHKWRGITENPGDETRHSSVLGIDWDRYEDHISVSAVRDNRPSTKRQFLSTLASIFDPLGLLAPLVLKGKILLQRIWRKELGWDSPLPSVLQTEVNSWMEGVRLLSTVKFPRHIPGSAALNLHVFVDASESGLGAVVYAVSDRAHLIAAKSKVAPLKNVSLPRLELQAAIVGVRVLEMIRPSLPVTPARIQFWSDSQVTLAWIKSSSDRRWKTFVANRVAEIRTVSTPDQWNHVSGRENPADLVSRGCVDQTILSAGSLWQSGPSWLPNEEEWPCIPHQLFVTEEEKHSQVMAVTEIPTETRVDLFVRLNSWTMLVRVMAWILRWVNYRSISRRDGFTTAELQTAENRLVKFIQLQSFDPEIRSLTIGSLKSSSRLRLLHPYLDDDGVIRVGGRLRNSCLPQEAQFPIILPSDHRYSELLVRQTHEDMLHSGVDSMVIRLRQKYWMLKCRRLCRSVRTKCVHCKRFDRPMPVCNPKFAPLPRDRVVLSAPFRACGIDYLGPLKIKSAKAIKPAYILLFVCASTRACHAEVTNSLSASDFMLAFRKFVARYGTPSLIRSDNAKTFKKVASVLRCEWHFNPPHAPWWGGFYERFCQLIKRPLRKVLHCALITKEELDCLLAEIVSIINQRPLTTPSDDPADAQPITPANLMGINFTCDLTVSELDQPQMTKRLRYLQNLNRQVQSRWKHEYLVALHKQMKQGGPSLSFRTGDVVLVASERPRSVWPLAVILETIPGSDGITRVVRLRCRGSVMLRPVQKLLPLELSVPSDTTLIETDVPIVTPVQPVHTRSGRHVKAAQRLDL